MQLSLHADYACRVLIHLAVGQETRSSIEEIARAFAISQNHLVKVVHRLGQLGFIETTRGRNGGIRLAMPPEKISMGAVIRRMEPHFEVVECLNSSTNTCPIVGLCGLQPALQRARDAFLQVLDDVTLADVTRKKKDLARALGLQIREGTEGVTTSSAPADARSAADDHSFPTPPCPPHL
ncbi:RrF2 family transcriptional regulator [Oligoflexus tunisiensis]|uniref:RrF2 family transcriptional regulator n=1 Tax=Oligoflexus tunisiensis TaxID=708132 RepID=UPI000B0F631C|nr:Rrf2 family transcriptional regulator [Oligoflexus tunisiensis]